MTCGLRRSVFIRFGLTACFALILGSLGSASAARTAADLTCAGAAPTITGTDNDEILEGTGGADVIAGLGGNDVINGLGGNDKLCGGDGDDLVRPGAGSDSAEGGAGVDTISYETAAAGVVVNLTNGDMYVPSDPTEYDTFVEFENATGSPFADTIIGSAAANTLVGGGGADALHGYAGNDTLAGAAGVDEFHGYEGDDVIQARDGVLGELIGCGDGVDSGAADTGESPAADCESVALGAASAVSCQRYADLNGDDANNGMSTSPVRHLPRLIELLQPGQTGCLTAGQTFDEQLGTFIVGNLGGTAGNPVTIRSSGSPRASIFAQMWLQGAAHDIVFRDLNFIGAPAPDRNTMMIIDGDRLSFTGDDITWRRGICLDVGGLDAYTPGFNGILSEDFVLERSRIHDCGADLTDVGASGVHGIYLVYTQNARIANNYIYDNRVRGVQLWPNATGTLIEYNVVDGNSGNLNIGSCHQVAEGCDEVGGQPEKFSSGTEVRNNIFSNAVFWFHTDTHQIYGNFRNNGVNYQNAVHDNCVYQTDPSKNFGGYGYTQSANLLVDPLYVNRVAKDFTLQPGSPCAGKGPQPTGPPTAALVSWFGARRAGLEVRLSWRTRSDLGLLGFNVWRATTTGGSYRRLNTALVRSHEKATGSSYRYVDAGSRFGTTRLYRLELVGLSGERTFVGPVRVGRGH